MIKKSSVLRNLTSWTICALLALQTPALGLASAHANPSKLPEAAEIEASIKVADQYIDLLTAYERATSGDPTVRISNDRTMFSLLQQKVHIAKEKGDTAEDEDGAAKIRIVQWWDTQVEIVDFNSGQSIKSVLPSETANFKPVPRNPDRHIHSCEQSQTCTINLLSKNDELLNEFKIASKHIAVFGRFIVFTRPGSYDSETGIQHISLIDLKTHEPLIGNESIPVFDIPITLNEPIESLEMAKHTIRINGSRFYLHAGQLKDLSHIYSALFNVKASLVNPQTYEGALTLANHFGDMLDKYASKLQKEDWATWENGHRAAVDINNLKRKILGDIDHQVKFEIPRTKLEAKHSTSQKHGRAVIGNAEKVLAKASKANQLTPEQNTKVSQFLTSISEMTAIDSALEGVQFQMKHAKKIVPSAKRLAIFLMSPKPFSSQVVKAALTTATAYKMVKKGSKPRKVLEWLANRPLATAAMVAAGVAGAYFPEQMGALMYSALNTGVDLSSSFGSGVTGAGEAVWAGSEPFITRVNPLMLVPTLNDAYINGGNWAKFSIAMSGLAVNLAIITGLYHVGQNIVRSDLESQRPGWRGLLPRYQRILTDYREALAKSEGERRQQVKKREGKFTEEQQQRAKDEIAKNQERFRETRKNSTYNQSKIKVKKGLYTILDIHDPDMAWVAAKENVRSAVGVFRNLGKWKSLRWLKSKTSGFLDFMNATKLMVFSYASYNQTALDYSAGWNSWSGVRYSIMDFLRINIAGRKVPVFIKARPTGVYMRLMYPRFFKKVVTGRLGRTTIPTEYNGGTDNFGQTVLRSLKYHLAASLTSSTNLTPEQRLLDADLVAKINALEDAEHKLKHPDTSLTQDEKAKVRAKLKAQIKKLKPEINELTTTLTNKNPINEQKNLRAEFEDKIIDLEGEIANKVIRKALSELIQFVQDEKSLVRIFRSEGIDSIASKTITELTYAQKTFIRTYFDHAFEEAMEKALLEILEPYANDGSFSRAVASEALSASGDNWELQRRMQEVVDNASTSGTVDPLELDDLKRLWASHASQNTEDKIEISLPAKRVAQIVTEVTDEGDHYAIAAAAAKKSYASARNINKNMKHNFLSRLDPRQNSSMMRYAVVQKLREDPQAMARAIRGEITELFTTLPIDLTFKLALTAGITEGPLKPLQSEMFAQNSIFYFSRMNIYNGLVGGVWMGLLANSWVALQENQMNEEAGTYGKIPKGKHAEESFLKWWLTQYRSKDNSVFANYKKSWSVAGPNLPAAIPNIALFQYPMLGRVDLDLILAGYLYSILPIGAWFRKVEQSFEMAAHYDYMYFSEDLWDHPDVQSELQKMSHHRRVKFNILRDLSLNPVGEMLGNILVTPTDGMGTRGLMRSILPGDTLLTEHILNGIHSLAEASKGVPGAEELSQAMYDACESLLSNGNPELTKLKK